MLSILLPIYNYEVSALVRELARQAERIEHPIEIRLLDDASTRPDHNAGLHDGERIFYERLPQNIGRAAIRNRLAERAAYPYLLFIDSDAAVLSDSFLQTYFDQLDEQTVLCGGTRYSTLPPDDAALYLRWYYGKHREERPADQRDRGGFTTFNFLIPRSIFQQIRFEELSEYGHEDTLFGYELERRSIPIKHLDNALRHDGLEPAGHFLEKSAIAVENLLRINHPSVRAPTKLWRTYEQLRSLGLTGAYRQVFRQMESRIEQNLLGANPSLRLFDLWKLGKLTVSAGQTSRSQAD